MSLWTITLILGYALVLIINLIFDFTFGTIANFLICACITMLPAIIFLFAGRTLPKKFFSSNNRLFTVDKFKQWMCKITSVKSWKDKIPVGGKVSGFNLKNLDRPNDIEYLNRFVYESCFAEWLHLSLVFWSIAAFGISCVIGMHLALCFGLPIAVLFAYQNMTSTIIQWHTRPKIVRLRSMLATQLGVTIK